MVNFSNVRDVGRILALRERAYRRSNREKSLQPRHSKHWCPSCDGAIIGAGSKCPRCGKRISPRRLKKE